MSNKDKEIKAYLRSGAPGRGKTHDLLHNKWKNVKGRCLYLTHSHQTCAEKFYELGGEPYVRHIKGLASCCPCLQKMMEERSPKEQIIADLVEHNFSNKVICNTCRKINAYPQKNCPYRKQFKGIRNCHIVVTVIQCVYGTNLFYKFLPDYIAMDDCLDYINPQPWLRDLNYQLVHLTHLAKIELENSENPIELLSNEKNFDDIMVELRKAYNERLKKLVMQIKKRDSSSYNKTFLIPPEEIETYIQMAKIYGFRKRFATPAIFHLFDYVVKQKQESKNVQLMIIDARQPYDLLEVMKNRYCAEKGLKVNFIDDTEFKPRIVEQNSVVYKMGQKNAWYSEESIQLTTTQEHIKETIEWIFYYFYNKNPDLKIGLVTRKPKKKWVKRLGLKRALKRRIGLFFPEQYLDKIEVETYGNLRGKNALKDCKILFVLGTYVVNKSEMKQMVSDWFCCDPKTMETVEDEPHGGYYHYKDRLAEILRKRREEYEMYQAVHRVRPLLSTKLIFAFAYVPEKWLKEDGIEVKKITRQKIFEKNQKRTEWLEDFVRANNRVPRVEAEEAFAEQFGISEKWAYREVLKIVKNSDCLIYKNHFLEFKDKQ